jgi:hypothetical protein
VIIMIIIRALLNLDAAWINREGVCIWVF